MTDKISLMLVDDHALVQQGIRAFLKLQEDLTFLFYKASSHVCIALVNGRTWFIKIIVLFACIIAVLLKRKDIRG